LFRFEQAEWHQAAECGPIEFSRDLAKGLAVEAYAGCSDVCPNGIPGCAGPFNERLMALSALIKSLFDAPPATAPRPEATSLSCQLVHD
jgi:hypothetical protein